MFSPQQESSHSHSSSGPLSFVFPGYYLVSERKEKAYVWLWEPLWLQSLISQEGTDTFCRTFCGYNCHFLARDKSGAHREVTSYGFPPRVNTIFPFSLVQMQFAKQDLFSTISKIT